MSKYNGVEGSFPVDGTETPITHQPIDQIDASQWHLLPSSTLYDHRITLQTRINMVMSMPNGAHMAQQLQRGVQHIEAILASRTDERIELI